MSARRHRTNRRSTTRTPTSLPQRHAQLRPMVATEAVEREADSYHEAGHVTMILCLERFLLDTSRNRHRDSIEHANQIRVAPSAAAEKYHGQGVLE